MSPMRRRATPHEREGVSASAMAILLVGYADCAVRGLDYRDDTGLLLTAGLDWHEGRHHPASEFTDVDRPVGTQRERQGIIEAPGK
jgi:hypothetical protein